MACTSYANRLFCSSSDLPSREGFGAYGCLADGVTITEDNKYSVTALCIFGSPSGTCSPVCACHSVSECYDECTSYVTYRDTPLFIFDKYLDTGDIIQAYTFNKIVELFNYTAEHLKISERMNQTYTTGDIIEKTDLDPIFTTYSNAFSNNDLGHCSFESLTGSLTNFVNVGGIIYASDWTSVFKHLQLLSTCCNCNADFVYVCDEVCYCVCFY